MKDAKSKLKIFNFKKQNIKLFVVFLVAAFFFLLLTKFSQNYTRNIQLNVQLTNLEDEIILLNDSANNAEVTIKTKGFNLLRYVFDPTKSMQIDAQKETFKSKKVLYWDIGNKKYQLVNVFGASVEIMDVKPDTLAFSYDVLASKYVPIKVNQNITYASGFDVVGKLKLSQDSVKIVGSKQVLDTINVLQTKLFELVDVKSNISQTLGFKDNFNNLQIIPNQVSINGNVKRFTEGKISLPITLKNVPLNKSVDLFPKNVDLVYYVDIENFNKVNPENFKVICDFKKLKDQSQRSLDLEIIQSSDLVKSSRLIQNRVEFIISE